MIFVFYVIKICSPKLPRPWKTTICDNNFIDVDTGDHVKKRCSQDGMICVPLHYSEIGCANMGSLSKNTTVRLIQLWLDSSLKWKSLDRWGASSGKDTVALSSGFQWSAVKRRMLLQLLLGVTWTLQDSVHTREKEKSHWHVEKELTLRLLELMEVPFEKTQEKLLCHTSLFRSGCLSRSVALDGLSVVSWWDWSLENFVWRNTDQWVPCAHSSPLCCWPGQGFGSNCTWWHWLQVVLQNKLWYFVHNPILISGLNMTAFWKSVIEVIDLVTKMVNVQTNMSPTGPIK